MGQSAPVISGSTQVIAHIGYPTHSFRAPLIYNPWFAVSGTDAVVVPFACEADAFEHVIRSVTRLKNFAGALVTMPHKQTVINHLDRSSASVRICGACNAVRVSDTGELIGDMFDGTGFVRGVASKGQQIAGRSALVIGAGGVGSAIAASLAEEGVTHLGLYDPDVNRVEALAARINRYFPETEVATGSNDPAGFDIVVNASPLGMRSDDPLPVDPSRLSPATFVGDVVLEPAITPLLQAARDLGCATQGGIDMLFEQIPAYLAFFGLPVPSVEQLRAVAQLPER